MRFKIGDWVKIPHNNNCLFEYPNFYKEINGYKEGIVFYIKDLVNLEIKSEWERTFPDLNILLALPPNTKNAWIPTNCWSIKPLMLKQFRFFFVQEEILLPAEKEYDL